MPGVHNFYTVHNFNKKVPNDLTKAKFSLESNFEIVPHIKSAFPLLQWTCSKGPWVLGGYGES